MAGARQAGDDTVDSASGSPTSHRTHELKLIVKGDVHGSVEAVVHALENLSKLNRRPRHDGGASADGTSSTDKIHVHILHSAVGPITSSDVELLAAAQRCAPAVESIGTAGRSVRHFLIGFNVPQPAKNVQQMIQRYRIPTITHNIIYNLLYVDEAR